MRIALLEDDEMTAKLVSVWLSGAGHTVHHFAMGASLLQALQRDSFDLLLLDWVLPDIQGDEVLQRVRGNLGWDVPVIFMTQKDSQDDIVRGLELGADDYMTKPVTASELLARINAVVRRFKPEAREQILDCGPYRIDLRARTVTCNGEPVVLTQKEFDLAAFIFRNVGRLVSRGHILESVWGRNASVTTRTVDIHMSRLRRKLGLGEISGWRLSAIYNHGYRLEPPSSETH